jgi:hypothetical protein
LTTCAKNGGQYKKKFKKKGAGRPCPGVDPRPAGDWWLLAGPGPTTGGRRPLVTGFLITFLLKIKLFFIKNVKKFIKKNFIFIFIFKKFIKKI